MSGLVYSNVMPGSQRLRDPDPSRVYTWSADLNNPVGSEYIIMEEPPATKLEDIWDELYLERKVEVVKDLVSLEKKNGFCIFQQV